MLLLDEPAAFLDVRHRLSFYELLAEVAARDGIACAVAMHDLDAAARFATQRRPDARRAAWSPRGTPDEVMTAARLGAALDAEIAVGVARAERAALLLCRLRRPPASLTGRRGLSRAPAGGGARSRASSVIPVRTATTLPVRERTTSVGRLSIVVERATPRPSTSWTMGYVSPCVERVLAAGRPDRACRCSRPRRRAPVAPAARDLDRRWAPRRGRAGTRSPRSRGAPRWPRSWLSETSAPPSPPSARRCDQGEREVRRVAPDHAGSPRTRRRAAGARSREEHDDEPQRAERGAERARAAALVAHHR